MTDERWIYCAVRDQPDMACAWPNCTCALDDVPEGDGPLDPANPTASSRKP